MFVFKLSQYFIYDRKKERRKIMYKSPEKNNAKRNIYTSLKLICFYRYLYKLNKLLFEISLVLIYPGM